VVGATLQPKSKKLRSRRGNGKMKHRLKRKSEDWRRKLPRPIVVRGGKTLRLLSDCRSYAVDLDRDEAARSPWQHAAELMLAAAKGGRPFD
jgi:hypothetical protein